MEFIQAIPAAAAVPESMAVGNAQKTAFFDLEDKTGRVTVRVKEKHPFEGPLVLRVDGKDRTLGATVANQVFVQKSA